VQYDAPAKIRRTQTGAVLSCEHSIERALRAGGHRVTVQRSKILTALRHARGHLTADAIHERVTAAEPHAAISLSTVYRTLEALRDAGLVVQLETGTGAAVFEWAHERGPHHHLVCRDCGAVGEVSSDAVERLAEEIRHESGFEPEIRHLGITGRCAGCADRAAVKSRGGA
jgi:Fur family transcriptional regulator, ferric uptake regulator